MKKTVLFIIRFFLKINNDRIRAHSAEAAFFIIMSVFPVLMLLLNAIRYTPITQEQILEILEGATWFEITPAIAPTVNTLFKSSGRMVPWVILLALWASSKSIIGLMDGLNSVYHISEERNPILLRIRSMFYVVVMVLALGVSIVILIFGYDIVNYIVERFEFLRENIEELTVFPIIMAMLILVLLFSILYTYLPNHKHSFLRHMPGAVFTSVAWTVFSNVFSIYLGMAGNMTILYGGLAGLIGIMMWLYICMYLLFIGAEINDYLIHPDAFGINN